MDRQQNTNSPNNRPADVLRDGAIKATIWQNDGEKGAYHNTIFAKTYEDKDGKLRDTHSFTGSDLLKVAELARAAYVRTNELRRDLGHDQQPELPIEEERDQRRTQYQDKRSQGGGGGRSPVPRRQGNDLADAFRPSL